MKQLHALKIQRIILVIYIAEIIYHFGIYGIKSEKGMNIKEHNHLESNDKSEYGLPQNA